MVVNQITSVARDGNPTFGTGAGPFLGRARYSTSTRTLPEAETSTSRIFPLGILPADFEKMFAVHFEFALAPLNLMFGNVFSGDLF